MAKKHPLSFYETSFFVGMLLDLITLARKLEEAKLELVQCSELFNVVDCFEHLLKLGGRYEKGFLGQVEFKEALMKLGVRGDRNTMDRIYLFFRRYNMHRDDRLIL